MRYGSIVHLLYHELEVPGRELCGEGKGYVRYVVRRADFRAQVASLQRSGLRGLSVTAALEPIRPRGVAITFDDGCETDSLVAAPLLHEAAFSATFYVIVGFIGRRGYMAAAQVRELSDSGFEIGCHSMTHSYLDDLDVPGLRAEVVEPKHRLEDLIGRRVDHFSCPKGRWHPLVARVAQDAGYRSVASGRVGANTSTSDPYQLARVTVLRGTSLSHFERLYRGKALAVRRAQGAVLAAAKALLGNTVYDRVRTTLLDRDS